MRALERHLQVKARQNLLDRGLDRRPGGHWETSREVDVEAVALVCVSFEATRDQPASPLGSTLHAGVDEVLLVAGRRQPQLHLADTRQRDSQPRRRHFEVERQRVQGKVCLADLATRRAVDLCADGGPQ